ncbi:hypothetical protein B0H14DRAFT_2570260 [Mycena olivaceomarginata]|nr:hypothetical protein B0H14DRAFT_2570260 [Mycena olivaceomarginata]
MRTRTRFFFVVLSKEQEESESEGPYVTLTRSRILSPPPAPLPFLSCQRGAVIEVRVGSRVGKRSCRPKASMEWTYSGVGCMLQDLCAVAIYLPVQDARGVMEGGRGKWARVQSSGKGRDKKRGVGCCRWWRGGCSCWGHRPRTSAGAAGSVGAGAGDAGIFDAARAERMGASSAAGNTTRRRVLALLVLLVSWTVIMARNRGTGGGGRHDTRGAGRLELGADLLSNELAGMLWLAFLGAESEEGTKDGWLYSRVLGAERRGSSWHPRVRIVFGPRGALLEGDHKYEPECAAANSTLQRVVELVWSFYGRVKNVTMRAGAGVWWNQSSQRTWCTRCRAHGCFQWSGCGLGTTITECEHRANSGVPGYKYFIYSFFSSIGNQSSESMKQTSQVFKSLNTHFYFKALFSAFWQTEYIWALFHLASNSDCETAEGCWLLVFVPMEGRGQKNPRCTDPYNVGCCGGKQRVRGAIGRDKLASSGRNFVLRQVSEIRRFDPGFQELDSNADQSTIWRTRFERVERPASVPVRVHSGWRMAGSSKLCSIGLHTSHLCEGYIQRGDPLSEFMIKHIY